MMKKIITLTLGLLFVFSLAAFGKTLIIANAETETPNIIITTDYNQKRRDDEQYEWQLIRFEFVGGSAGTVNPSETDLVFSYSYPTVSRINIIINESLITAKHFDCAVPKIYINNMYVNDAERLLGKGDYEYTVPNPDILTEIRIEFEPKSYEITARYLEVGKIMSGTLDKNFIEYYTVKDEVATKLNAVGGEYWVQYNQKLRIEIADNITFNNNQKSYDFDSLYFNVRDETMLAKTFVYDVNDDFLEYYEEFFGKIDLLVYYTQNFKFSLKFANTDLAVDYQVNNKDTNTAITEGQFFKSATNLQVTMKLLPYTKLAKLANGRYNIGGLNYTLDQVAENGENVTIDVVVFDRDINLEINFEFITFETQLDFSEGTQVNGNKSFKYGDKVVLFAIVENTSKELKTWKINDIQVPKIGQTANGITRIDASTVEIDTAVWYEKFGVEFIRFDSNITTRLNDKTILAIAIPTGVVVLAAGILLLIVLMHARTKRKIRILLEKDMERNKEANLRFSTGGNSYIDTLRAGKSMTVTDEDVKAEMERRKHKKPDASDSNDTIAKDDDTI